MAKKKYKIRLHDRIEEYVKGIKERFEMGEATQKVQDQDNERLKELKKYLNIKQ